MNCKICGKEIEKSSYSNEILCSSECFSKHYWLELVKIKDKPNMVRIDGIHYVIGKNNATFKGFGGRSFKIEFNDGRIVETTNLWYQGEIPVEYKEVLTDNAKFVQEGDDWV